jgi:hypothetical protein
MTRNLLLLILFTVTTSICVGQFSVKDTTLRMSLFQFQGGYHGTGGDMGELYGGHAFVGFSYAYKSGTNILLGVEGNFLFGNSVNNPDQVMSGIRNSAGGIVGIEGEFVNALIAMRGYTAGFYVGKIWPIFGPNPNSGLVAKLGVSYMEHRTYIEARQDDIPPIEGEYKKGYDRKRAGISLNQFVGYQHFSNSRFANFYVGLDIYQGFTTDYRSYNFDDMAPTNGDYFDTMFGFKFGWVIPVYKRVADKFYID